MKANNFTLPSTNKSNYTLKDSIGKYVVIYFYPKDDTFMGYSSKDSIKSHDKFRDNR